MMEINYDGINTIGETQQPQQQSYQLPDGTTIDLSSSFGKDLCQLPELLFSDTVPFSATARSTTQTEPSSPLLPTLSSSPLHKLVLESLKSVGDVDIRKELAGSICLAGGTSLLPNIDVRLSQELTNIVPSFVKPKVVASRISVERSCASWIGGSILTSLGSFQQLWLSKTEYDEYGAALAIQRFP
jgi:actin-related protein